MSGDRPNILFIMSDHQRADSLGMVQGGHEVTPNLNRLCREGTVFERAYNTCPLCAPARTALATGLAPHTNGVIWNDWEGVTAGPHKPMHQYLAEAGYRAGHVGVHHIRVRPPLEERVKFAAWYSNPQYGQYVRKKGIRLPDPHEYQQECREVRPDGSARVERFSSTRTGVFPCPREDFLDWQFTDAACAFLRERDDAPLALFVYLWAPHPPLIVPEPYASLFSAGTLTLPWNVCRRAEGEPAPLRKGVPAQLAQNVVEGEWREVWSAHLGLVRLVDDCVGRILRALDDGGGTENTVVVFSADHGDHLGAHDLYQKMEMYEEAIRVPLVIRAPGAPAGTRDGLVSHLDLLPTVLDFAGVGVPRGLHGRSLKETIGGGAGWTREAVFSGYDGDNERGYVRRGVVGTRFKYVWYADGGEELYDLQRDPWELANLASNPQFAAEKARLRSMGIEWARATGDRADWAV